MTELYIKLKYTTQRIANVCYARGRCSCSWTETECRSVFKRPCDTSRRSGLNLLDHAINGIPYVDWVPVFADYSIEADAELAREKKHAKAAAIAQQKEWKAGGLKFELPASTQEPVSSLLRPTLAGLSSSVYCISSTSVSKSRKCRECHLLEATAAAA